MIMRDVVLSSEPRALRPPSTASGTNPHPSVSTVAQPPKTPQSVPTPQSLPPPSKPALTLDAVNSWLATQSVETRAAVAHGLATDLSALREQARAQGLETGRTQGLQEFSQRTESCLAALTRINTAAEEAFAQEAAQLSEACADIVAAAFVKLAGEHLPGREAILGAVTEVLKRVKDPREVTIRVSQQDLPLLREGEPLIQQVLGARHVTLSADPRVSVGGCLVESSLGTLDGRLEVQIRELFETIRAAKASRWTGA